MAAIWILPGYMFTECAIVSPDSPDDGGAPIMQAPELTPPAPMVTLDVPEPDVSMAEKDHDAISISASWEDGPHKYDCCINYTQKPVPIRFIKGYMEQSSLTVCSIDAIIFLTVQDKKVCASSKDAWVKSAMRRLSYRLKQLSKKSPGGNGDGKRAIPGTFTAIATPAAP
ncbi:UNVERIFIED_CONTAM: hypothetical protein FKN15_045984 [Acipenser sinensis]